MFLFGTPAVLLLVAGSSGCVGDDPALVDGDAAGGADPVCNRYCAEITNNCKGPDRQYRDPAECAKFCALLTPGSAGDKGVDTVECRLAQAKLAASKEACVSAGPYGGDVCGRRCEAFCTVVEANCSATAPPPYSSRSTCIETCNGFPFDPKVGEGPDQPFKGADNLNCRGFHMILSLEDKVGHCPHTGATSATCLNRDAGGD